MAFKPPPNLLSRPLVALVAIGAVSLHLAAVWWVIHQPDHLTASVQTREIRVEVLANRQFAVPAETPQPVTKPEPEPTPPLESDPAPEPELRREPGAEAESVPEPERQVVPEPAPIPESDLDPEAAPEPEPEPEPASELPIQPEPQMAASAPPSVPITDANHQGEGLNNPVPRYPPAAYFDRLQGTVKLRVRVLPTGRVADVIVEESSGHRLLDNSALETLQEWEFIPAEQGGKAIEQWVEIPITFQLVED